jgi:mono/diheme cytochrome c family protein
MMSTRVGLCGAAALLLALVAAGAPQGDPSSPPQSGAALIERGSYLVQHVAMCVQCHTPRDSEGNLIPSLLLHGEAMPVRSPFPRIEWAVRAQHIAGLPGYTVEQGVRLLVEGISASGGRPKPPMPPFRMNREDAEAVVAFLKSLP